MIQFLHLLRYPTGGVRVGKALILELLVEVEFHRHEENTPAVASRRRANAGKTPENRFGDMELIVDECKESLVTFPAARRQSDARQLKGADESYSIFSGVFLHRAKPQPPADCQHSLPSRSES
jgi:hypothetical protein